MNVFVEARKLGEDPQKLKRRRRLTIANAEEYAVYLDEREGYFVISPAEIEREVYQSFNGVINAEIPLTNSIVTRTLRYSGESLLKWHRAFTGEIRPPAKRGEGPRRARRGHWADITGNLAKGYFYLIDGRPSRSKRSSPSSGGTPMRSSQ